MGFLDQEACNPVSRCRYITLNKDVNCQHKFSVFLKIVSKDFTLFQHLWRLVYISQYLLDYYICYHYENSEGSSEKMIKIQVGIFSWILFNKVLNN